MHARFMPTALAAVLLALTAAAAALPAHASDAVPDLPLEELLKADVQTASRKSQRLQDVAAAVFVIHREDIERSGAMSIPDLLRMVPGVEVAAMGNNRWAVSARGFNSRYANKLLVLMDGRSIYSPLFSGVLWESEDTLLEDIERIEVIRGPGAALWGANAVNGVINIITRHARDTRGTLAVAAAGNEQRGLLAVREGLQAGDGNVRLWAKVHERDETEDAAGRSANDGGRARRAGFRGDWAFDGAQRLSVSGMVYGATTDDRWTSPSLTSPTGIDSADTVQHNEGFHVLARHERLLGDGSETALQTYIDRTRLTLGPTFAEQRSTIDVDFQHRLRLGESHDVVWGLGVRESRDEIEASGLISVPVRHRTWRLWNLFVQDEITLVPKRLKTVLGARLDHNSFTGAELQPNVRLAWTPDERQTVWAALSRAVRTPSRAEEDALVNIAVIPAQPPNPPVLVRSEPDPVTPMQSERLVAFELGWRRQIDNALSVDVALFRNRYDRLVAGVMGAPFIDPDPVLHVVQPNYRTNDGVATTRGFEAALDWHPSRTWRLQPSYSYIRLGGVSSGDATTQVAWDSLRATLPQHQVSLRSSHALPQGQRVDVWLRYVSELPGGQVSQPVPAYTTLDLRYAKRVSDALELSLVGQNLLDSRHAETYSSDLVARASQVQRSVYAKAKWQF